MNLALSPTATRNPHSAIAPAWRFSGFWLAGTIAALMYLNALRTFANPAGFAEYMGLLVRDGADLAWVQVYGLRAFLIGAVVTVLLLRRQAGALKWIALCAAPVALGDAWLVSQAGGAAVARHLGIAVFLVVAAMMLHRWDRALGGTRGPSTAGGTT